MSVKKILELFGEQVGQTKKLSYIQWNGINCPSVETVGIWKLGSLIDTHYWVESKQSEGILPRLALKEIANASRSGKGVIPKKKTGSGVVSDKSRDDLRKIKAPTKSRVRKSTV